MDRTTQEGKRKNMYKLNHLIGSHLYDKAAERIRQEQKNKAYTDAWAQEQTTKLNKEWLNIVRMAVAENNGEIQQKQDEYNRVQNTNFRTTVIPRRTMPTCSIYRRSLMLALSTNAAVSPLW